MSRLLEEWMDDPNEYECPHCGGGTRINGFGGPGIGVKCEDIDCPGWFQEAGYVAHVNAEKSGEPPVFRPPEEWVTNGEAETFRYRCPHCASTGIVRTSYDDGCGYVDVKVECQSCWKQIWE